MPKRNVYLSVTPTIDTSVYADADQLGSLMTFEMQGDYGPLRTMTVVDAISQNAAMTLHLFKEQPTIASSDNGALDISDAELAAKYIGKIEVGASDYQALANASVAMVQCEVPVQTKEGKFYGILQSQGTPTYTGAGNLTIKLGY